MRIDKLLSGEEVSGASWRLAGGRELVGRDGYSSGKAVVPRWWRILLGRRMLLALLLCFDLAFRGSFDRGTRADSVDWSPPV